MDNNDDMCTPRRFFLLLVLALTGVASAGQDQNRKVTFSQVAASADQLLKALGDATGTPLRATPTTAKDILLIAVKDVPLNVLMQKIAEAENASWEKENDGYRLNRSATQQRADEDRERLALATHYAEDLKKVGDEAVALQPLSPSAAQGLLQKAKEAGSKMQDGSGWQLYNQVSGQSPAGRLLIRLLAGFRAEDLAAVPENGRVVFADVPNRAQKRLSGSPGKAIDQFVAEQGVLSSAAAGESSGDNPYFQIRSLAAPLKTRPAKVIVVATRRPLDGSVSISMEILDAGDRILGTASRSIGGSMERLMPQLLAKPGGTDKPIKLSPASLALRSSFKLLNGSSPVSGTSISDELKKKIADTVKNEPLGYATSDGLLGYAEQKGLNLVAVLNDASIMALFPFTGGEMMPSQVPLFLGVASEEQKIADGWLTVTPMTPATSRETRTDRAALRLLLQTMLSKGTLTLDDAAAYALSCPSVRMDIVAMLFTAAIQPTSLAVFEQNGMAPLRFYGAVTAAQRPLIASRQPVSLASLSPVQRTALSEIVYGPDSRLNSMRGMSGDEAQAASYLTSEPTELLPNGWAPEGRFSFVTSVSLVVIPMKEGGIQIGDSGMDANTLAWRMYAQINPSLNGGMASDPRNQINLDSLLPATKTSVQMHFDLNDRATVDQQLRQYAVQSKPVAFANLPAEFRKQYEQSYAQQKQMQSVSPFPGGAPPPPRA